MIAAAPARSPSLGQRLLHIDRARGALTDLLAADLPSRLREGDLLVLNDAATLPASLEARTEAGAFVELRLSLEHEDGSWRAVLFGEGDHRTPTERRPPPPRLEVGDRLLLGGGVEAELLEVDPESPRLVRLRFSSREAAFWGWLFRTGRPIQYSYHEAQLLLRQVQTPYASRPWAVEIPSAGRPLLGRLVGALRARGVRIARLTHAAGLSSTGDPALDARLPLPERYEIPRATVEAVGRTRERGGRVIAVGTSVTRALEAHARKRSASRAEDEGSPRAERAITGLRLGPGTELWAVDGLLTGVHDQGSSHYALLGAFLPPELHERAAQHSAKTGYYGHEFGDSWLIL